MQYNKCGNETIITHEKLNIYMFSLLSGMPGEVQYSVIKLGIAHWTHQRPQH